MDTFLLFCLAVYGASTLVVYEDGPCDILKRFRKYVGAEWIGKGTEGQDVVMPCNGSQLGKMFSCRLCCGLWIGVLFAIILVMCPYLLLPFAGVGFVCMIQELSSNVA